RYSTEELAKIGNAIVYFSQKISLLSKTKLLKLLYILDEIAIERSGIPVLNLRFKVWKFGPVAEDIFIELSSEASLLKNYISKELVGEHLYILSEVKFDDDEFTDNDINFMDEVIREFGNKSVSELIDYTHRENGPWYKTAKKNGVLHLLQDEKINNTELVIDLRELVLHDERKLTMYENYISVD